MRKEIKEKPLKVRKVELPEIEPVDKDIDAIIRENFNFLKEQMIQDACEKRFLEEEGEDWIQKSTGKTIQEIAKGDLDFRMRLERAIGQELGVDGWHFQNDKLEIPAPTRQWVSKKTGITAKRLESLDKPRKRYASGATGGQAFTVSELIAIANATNTSIQCLLTPSHEKINSSKEIAYYGKGRRDVAGTTNSNWILWLHALQSLPEQTGYHFERNTSYVAGAHEIRGKNAKPFKDDVIKGLAKSRYGALSKFEAISDWSKLEGELAKITISTPLKSKPTFLESEIWKIRHTLGLFVEMRKLLRHENSLLPDSQINSRWKIGIPKVSNYLILLGRLRRKP